MTLVGASIIFLILAGSFLQNLLSNAASEFHLSIRSATLVCGCIASVHSFIRDLREFGFMSAFNVFVSVYLFFVICLEVATKHKSHHHEQDRFDTSGGDDDDDNESHGMQCNADCQVSEEL